jgi:O-antigen ligase
MATSWRGMPAGDNMGVRVAAVRALAGVTRAGTFGLWQLGVLLAAALVGVIAGLSPTLGLAAAFGLVYVVLVFQDLALGLALFLGLTFLESVTAFSALSLAKVTGGLLAFSWLALVASNRAHARQLAADHPALATALLALGAWSVMSAVWAEFPDAALGGAQRWILNLVLIPIVYTAVREPRHVRWMFVAFVVGALVSAALGLATGLEGDESTRLGGSGINANELGDLLIVAVVLAAALGCCRDLAPPARALAFVSAGLCVLALLMTVSRGALLGLIVALVLTPVLIGPGRRVLALGLIVTVAAAGAFYLLALAPASARERITQADTQGSGRTDIWKVGLRMVEAHPVLGVGADNYRTSTIHYLLQPGTVTRSDYIVDDPHVAHNIYLQVQAELGVGALAAYLGIIGFSLWCCVNAARRFRARHQRSMEVLSRALLIGLCGLLASAFFSNAVYNKQLWLLMALGMSLRTLALQPR